MADEEVSNTDDVMQSNEKNEEADETGDDNRVTNDEIPPTETHDPDQENGDVERRSPNEVSIEAPDVTQPILSAVAADVNDEEEAEEEAEEEENEGEIRPNDDDNEEEETIDYDVQEELNDGGADDMQRHDEEEESDHEEDKIVSDHQIVLSAEEAEEDDVAEGIVTTSKENHEAAVDLFNTVDFIDDDFNWDSEMPQEQDDELEEEEEEEEYQGDNEEEEELDKLMQAQAAAMMQYDEEAEAAAKAADEREEEEMRRLEQEAEQAAIARRSQLVQQIETARTQRRAALKKNAAVQHKLCLYFNRISPPLDTKYNPDSIENQQFYRMVLDKMVGLSRTERVDYGVRNAQCTELRHKLEKQMEIAQNQYHNLLLAKKQAILGHTNDANLQQKRIQFAKTYVEADLKKWMEMADLTSESLFNNRRIRHLTGVLKKHETITEGLLKSDYEQLKKANEVLGVQNEDSYESTVVTRRNFVTNVHHIAHMREKIFHVNIENDRLKAVLDAVDKKLTESIAHHKSSKKTRDYIRHDNREQKERCGLLGYPELLLDLEEQMDNIEPQSSRLVELQRTYAYASRERTKLDKKIAKMTAENSR